MYKRISKFRDHRPRDMKVLSISHSGYLAQLVGFADQQSQRRRIRNTICSPLSLRTVSLMPSLPIKYWSMWKIVRISPSKSCFGY